MSVIVPLVGAMRCLEILTTPGAFTMKLFKNNLVPNQGTTLLMLTEADFSGYLPVNLVGWTSPVPDGFGRAITNSDPALFTHDAGLVDNDIYGYYVIQGLADLLWVERFATAPIAIENNGETITVKPYFTQRSEF
jgi:hypothetical protein